MTINPQTTLYLCNVPIENDYKNQLTFSNINAQRSYFESKVVKTYINTTYIRKDQPIEVPFSYDDVANINYLYFINNGHSAKYYYCFVTRIEYVNENCSRLYIETDVFQTWYFQITYNRCFVEREHVNDDTIGANTIPENLETGEYISCNLQPTQMEMPTLCYVLATTYQLTTGYYIFGEAIPNGTYYYGFSSIDGVQSAIKFLDEQGAAESIVSVFVSFKNFFSNWQHVSGFLDEISDSINYSYSSYIDVQKTNYVGKDYVPKNNKLFTYPFNFLQVSNHSGTINTYNWEDFNLLTIPGQEEQPYRFRLIGTISPGGSFKLYPMNYKNTLDNYDESINLGKLPVGSYSNDSYTNWLTQNGVNIGLSTISSGIQIASGVGMVATGGGALAGASNITSGLMGIASTLGSVYQHSLVPDSIGGNTNNGDVNYINGLTNFEFKRISIKNEYCKIIDDFFSSFGYKVNRIKVPNITGRRNWNFVKTIDANMTGSIPQDDLNKIRDMFNNGVTLWHNPNNIFNYSLNNDII